MPSTPLLGAAVVGAADVLAAPDVSATVLAGAVLAGAVVVPSSSELTVLWSSFGSALLMTLA